MITTRPTTDGKRIEIRFPYDAALVETVRGIPGAKWDRAGGCWHVAKRYAKQIDAFAGVAAEANAAFAAVLDNRADALRKASAGRVQVVIDPKTRVARVSPLSRPGTRDVFLGPIRDLQGAHSVKECAAFSHYRVPVSDAGRLDALIAAVAKAVADADERAAAFKADAEHRAAERARASQEEADARVAKAQAALAAERAAGRGRYGVLLHGAPAVGTVLRRGDDIVRVTALGRSFRLDDESSSMGWPSGCEGEEACHVEYERASDTEAAALVEREQAAAAEKSIRARRAAAVAQVEASTDAPEVGAEPAGETIWSDDSSAPHGWRRWIVLTPDGWLWSLTYAGGDGDSWGMRNAGYCTSGRRLRATDELVAAIRG